MDEIGKYVKKKYGRTEYLTAGERHENKLELQRKWRLKNREKTNAYARRYARIKREMRPDLVKEYKKSQYLKHKEYYIEKSRQWRLNNKEKYNAKLRELYQKTKAYRNKPKCMGCECILKEGEQLVCQWCIFTYPHKYANINK